MIFRSRLLTTGLIFLALEEVGEDRLRRGILRPLHLIVFFKLELSVAWDNWFTGQLLLLAGDPLLVLLRILDLCCNLRSRHALLWLVTLLRSTVQLLNSQAGDRLLDRELLWMLLLWLWDHILVGERKYRLGLRLTVRYDVHFRKRGSELIYLLRYLWLIRIRGIYHCSATAHSYWLSRLEFEVTLNHTAYLSFLIAHAVNIRVIATSWANLP